MTTESQNRVVDEAYSDAPTIFLERLGWTPEALRERVAAICDPSLVNPNDPVVKSCPCLREFALARADIIIDLVIAEEDLR